MKKIVVFGASNSSKSINKQFAEYAASLIIGVERIILDLNNFEMPIYGIDKENNSGIPELAYQFKRIIKEADGIIISLAEHNGSYSVAFKNIFDWISRIEKSPWADKPMLLLATSPGSRGGKMVLETAKSRFQFVNNNEIFSFSLPSFNENFSKSEGILNEELSKDFMNQLNKFESIIKK